MGFLEKLEHLAEGSGVRVQLEILGPADPSGQSLKVQVTLEAKSEPHQVSLVEVGISERETGDRGGEADGEQVWSQMLWSTSVPVNAQLVPGQPLSHQLQVPTPEALGSHSMAARVGQFMAQSYGYYVQARATVEGSHLHPHAMQLLEGDTNRFRPF